MTRSRAGSGGNVSPGPARGAAPPGGYGREVVPDGLPDRRRRPLVRHVAVFAGLVTLACGLSGCAAGREEIGTVNGDCFLALPAALEAVHHRGHLEGVRLVSMGWLRARAPRLFAALGPGGTHTGAVCLVAFQGTFVAATVQRPFGDASGSVAIVELGFPEKQLFGTAVLARAPFGFAHSRA